MYRYVSEKEEKKHYVYEWRFGAYINKLLWKDSKKPVCLKVSENRRFRCTAQTCYIYCIQYFGKITKPNLMLSNYPIEVPFTILFDRGNRRVQ